MPDGQVDNPEIALLSKKVDAVYLLLNQFWIMMTSSGGPMSGQSSPAVALPDYPEPYTVGGTGEQFLPNNYGYRE